MEQIIEEIIYKTIYNGEEPEQVIDFTWKRTYWVENEQWTLIKTEKYMPDGTIYLVEFQDGCISQIQTYPEELPNQQSNLYKKHTECQNEMADLNDSITEICKIVLGGG